MSDTSVAALTFEVMFAERRAPDDPRIPQLIWWAARLAELGMTPPYGPGDHGNLSCRTANGLLISATSTQKSRLTPADIIEVLGVEAGRTPPRVRCRGAGTPSGDTLLHHAIYQRRPDIQAIIHGHDAASLEHAAALQLRMTRAPAVTTTPELIEEVCGLVQGQDYVLTRDHGFLALGASLDEAGELLRRVCRAARSL